MHARALSLRPIRDPDGPALARLIADCFAEYPGCLYDPAEFPELDAPARSYAERGAMLWVALDGEALVGSLAATPVPEQRAIELTKVYVAAGHRGHGLAQRLLGEAERFAQERGASALVLWSDTRFTRAHAFYEKHGFKRRPGLRYLADVSQSWEFRYERPLSQPAGGQ